MLVEGINMLTSYKIKDKILLTSYECKNLRITILGSMTLILNQYPPIIAFITTLYYVIQALFLAYHRGI